MASLKEVGPSGSHHRRQSRSLHAETSLPHFYRIILPGTLKDQKLRFPNKFASRLGKELSGVANITVPNGHAWQIGLTKAKNSIWFDDGWQKFVEHYSIDYGCLLLFGYRGGSNFDALIFNKTTCEIQYRHRGQTRLSGSTYGAVVNYDEKCSLNDSKEMEDEVSIEKTDSQYCSALKSGVFDEKAEESCKRHSSSTKKSSCESPDFEHFIHNRSKRPMKKEYIDESTRRKQSKKCRLSSPQGSLIKETRVNKGKLKPEFEEMEIVVGGFAKASQQSKKAIHAARMFKPKNPSFMILLRPYNERFVCIPTEFSRKHMSGLPEYSKLQVSDGRQWPIRITTNTRRRLVISKGWNEFYRENDLEEGDVCIFELIKEKKFALKVSIFRAVEDGPSAWLSGLKAHNEADTK